MKVGLTEFFGLLVVIGSAYLMFGRSPLGAFDITVLLVVLPITYFALRSSEAHRKSPRN